MRLNKNPLARNEMLYKLPGFDRSTCLIKEDDMKSHVHGSHHGISRTGAWTALTLLLGLAGTHAGMVSAQSGPMPRTSDAAWEKVVAAAKQEGRLFLYSSVPTPITDQIKKDFEAAYPGIVLEYQRFNSATLLSKVDSERSIGADGGDVLITTEVGWADARVKDGSAKAHIGPDARNWPKQFLFNGVVPVLALEPICIAYNVNLVKNPPKGYLDLLKPEYKGKVGILDIQAATLVAAYYDWLPKAYGADYLEKLAANGAFIYASAPNAAQSVGSGEYEIASFVNTASGKPIQDRGAPLRLVVPQPAFGTRYVGLALGWAKRPNAAQVFMNYVMSVRGQTAWAGKGDAASPLPNIPGSIEGGQTLVVYDPAPYTPEAVKAQVARWNQLFKIRK
jgi:iron(III) transport system substrate-binding protein